MEDKMKGLLLALSSTILIGSSFIVKKKGLRKAASTGVRAGEKSALGEYTVQGCLQGREYANLGWTQFAHSSGGG